MKKQILLTGIALLSLTSIQVPALADYHDWHRKYDVDNDGRWKYEEYQQGQRAWEAEHKRHPMSDKQLRDYYKKLDKDHDGYLSAEEMRRAHHW